ncbi:MAG: putative transposase, partial [Polaribacter sp.]
ALSYRNIEEMMAERGLSIDHSTLNRWVIKYAPLLEKAFHKKRKNQAVDGGLMRLILK